MQELFKKFILLTKILLAVFLAGTVLSLFCVWYLDTGVHIYNKSGATDYKWKSNQMKSTMIEGFAWLKMDEQGFNNSFPIKGDIDILLMGSSHMEAVNVASDKNTGYIMNELLPEYYTYNIGISGHTIYSCANNIHAAVSEYEPDEFVVIETDRIDLNIEDMQNVVSKNYPHIKSYDSGLVFFIQQYFPLAKNIYKQLVDWWSADTSIINYYENSKKKVSQSKDYEMCLDQFLEFIRSEAGTCKVIIVYQSPTELKSDGSLKIHDESENLTLFSQMCEKNDIIFVDTISAFESLYKEKHILAHGFTNTAVGSGHLNEYGHKLVAEVVAKTIKEHSNVSQ